MNAIHRKLRLTLLRGVSSAWGQSATSIEVFTSPYFGCCHTAPIGNYLVEDHVPATDTRGLLDEKPRALSLAVALMPPSLPGMESNKPISYETLSVLADRSYRTFLNHQCIGV